MERHTDVYTCRCAFIKVMGGRVNSLVFMKELNKHVPQMIARTTASKGLPDKVHVYIYSNIFDS